ncbi:MAG: glycosyltransferase [Candidatus Eisenbacteria bacterium]|uniref:Glycosyltransferase n=1 Tax=Eiseniibacteriota bacterium TaxID=2212470 RepID=A0A937X642_UNCEI|nr:glycosyltransferase [Candidatus Eisenbacteria bacterium]
MRTLHFDLGRRWRGGQRQCALLCRRLAASGLETHLVCRRGEALAGALAGSGVDLHELRAAGGGDPLAIIAAVRVLRRARPELIAAHEARGWGLAAAARALAGSTVPLVYHRRIDRPLGRAPGSRWKAARTVRFVCVSEAIAGILAASGVPAERLRVVHSGTPGFARVAGARDEIVREFGFSPGAILLGSVGGLLPHKGHALLVDAFARVAATEPRAALLVVGDGPERRSLHRRAAALGLGERVALAGERADVGRLMSALDLFVHPSLTEGLGTAILDAFSLRLPVVAARAGGIPEMVRPGETGWLVEPGDPAALAAGIAAALRERERAATMAEAAERLFRDSFTDAAMAASTLEVYRAAAAGSAAGPGARPTGKGA